ncbi:MAG TPA: hypothetical protein VK447_15975 [Myxococcaceae bacterium]|nr:hypothetical protein [Myxococcaceae bacterium]
MTLSHLFLAAIRLAPIPLLFAGLLSCDRLPREALTRCQAITVVPPATKTDILFVVDDSDSMTEEQQNLADNFEAFIAKLEASPFRGDYQIGITSTSVDLVARSPSGSPFVNTVFQRGPNAGKPYPMGALIAVDPATGAYLPEGRRILAPGSPTLIEDFRNNIKVGVSGSGKEQGLLAARLAVTNRITDGTNEGFLRPGARLAVIIVSDADDCSDPDRQVVLDQNELCTSATAKSRIKPVRDFVDALRQPLAGERRDVVVAVIGGVDPVTKLPSSSCAGLEDKADRYKEYVDQFPSAALIDDICNPSFRGTLEQIAGLIEPPVSVTVEPAPTDPRLLSVRVVRANGTRVPCTVALPGDANPGAADAVYVPSEGTRAARIDLQNACRLARGDQLAVELLCAG